MAWMKAGRVALWGVAVLALAAPAQGQLAQIELALKLRSTYGKGKFLANSPKYLTNYSDCRARGESDAACKAIVALCVAQEQPYFGGPYASLFRGLGLNQVFKVDCGSQECFQCCHVPGQGCHTSFVGFPVINCNERYGAGTNPAGLTLIVDPDAQPGDACLTTPQTCDHIARCLGDANALQSLRDELDQGAEHPLNAPGAPGNRARYFAQQTLTGWCNYLDSFHSGLPRDGEGFTHLVDIEHFLTGRGCVGWRQHVAAVSPIDWVAEWWAVLDEAGVLLPAASHRNGLCQWGLFRLLESVPNLGDRLTFIDSTLWPDALRDAYLAQVGDPDEALLRHASPIVRDLLRRNPGVSDYRLLAVPLPGEAPFDDAFNGCDLGEAPRIFLDAEPAGPDALRLQVEVRDPEVGGPYENPIEITIFWGDGRIAQHALAAGVGASTFEHRYAQGGRYHVIALAENTSGLRGFGAVLGATGAEGPGQADGPVVVSEVRLVDAVVRADTLTGNARTLHFDLDGHAGEATHALGVTAARPIEFEVDVALGTLVGHNTGAAPLDRITLRPHWRDGFYTGLRRVYLRAERLELHVFSTETGDTVPVVLPLGAPAVRVYAEGQADPLPAERLPTDAAGRLEILLHDRDHLTERIEIDLPQAVLAAAAPGPLPVDRGPLGQTSWVEQRPESFVAVGRDPDQGVVPDAGGPDGGLPGDGGGAGGGGGGAGDAQARTEAGPGTDGGAPAASGGGDCSAAGGTSGAGWLWFGLWALTRRRRAAR